MDVKSLPTYLMYLGLHLLSLVVQDVSKDHFRPFSGKQICFGGTLSTGATAN
jgi:hypothetical protein